MALAATGATALFLLVHPVRDALGRWYAGVAIVAMYLLSRRIAFRTAMEFLAPARGAAALLLLLAAPALHAQGAPTSVTLYDDGRVLVRRTLPLAIPAGDSEHRVRLGALDPATLLLTDDRVALLAATHAPTGDESAALRRAVGSALAYERPTPTGVERGTATLLGLDPERWRLADGSVTFARPGALRFPAALAGDDAATTLRVRSGGRRDGLGLAWFTTGAGWRATYQVVVAGGTARVAGVAELQAGALALDAAEVQLLAGSVRRVAPRLQVAYAMEAARVAGAPTADAPDEESVGGDVRVYTLPGRWSLAPGTTTLVPLHDAADVPVEKAYVVGGALPFRGFVGQEGDERTLPVEVRYTLARARGTTFGDRGLPAGIVRVHQPDADGRLQFVGEAAVRHTAPGQELRVTTGSAFDLTARRTQTRYATARDTARGRARTVMTAGYLVTLANATDSVVTIDVLEERAGEWSVVESSVPAERLSSTRARFRVRVPARGDARLTYTVRATW